jgi:probable phosphomutase (TIGR03848 family)
VTRLLLIRHAHHDYLGRAIAGRLAGVSISAQGRAEAAALTERLAGAGIAAIYSSPLERARQTAEPLARRLGLRIEICQPLSELDFGDWTGRTMAELEADPAWRRFNTQRAATRPPGGELMLEVQARMVAELERIRRLHPDASVAVVSHGDVIRAAVLHYAGIPLDFYSRIEIYPASISIIELDENGPRLIRLNEVTGGGT